jgi:phosphatidylserine/phosphatidylglycerophosphate/cardiolipin synthase-like enzyme
MNKLSKLTDSDLRGLVVALRSGRLGSPYSDAAVGRILSSHLAGNAAAELQGLANQDFQATQIATLLESLLIDRKNRPTPEDVIDLVVSGPESAAAANRDTAVVVRDLFASAQESVLVAGYAVYQGQHVFRALADRMEQVPLLRVQLFLDIQRPLGDTTIENLLVEQFLNRFRTQQWPDGKRLPDIYYDPRSLSTEGVTRSCLHAKCVVVDRHVVFISSANFTEAAQDRNIEVGLLVRSSNIARQLSEHFMTLADTKLLQAAKWRTM